MKLCSTFILLYLGFLSLTKNCWPQYHLTEEQLF